MQKTIRNLNRTFKKHGIQCKFMGSTVMAGNTAIKTSNWWLLTCEECETFPKGTTRAVFSVSEAWKEAEALLQERKDSVFKNL